LGLLLERESTLRQHKRFQTRAKNARLRHLAAVEDVDYRTPRGLDRTLFLKLAGCDWIRERRHCLLTGPSGVGKSWLACALGYKACRENLSVTSGCRGCLPPWRWPAVTAATPSCCASSPGSTC
jgi:DNA replication protein DnaC